jgi:hypothetical protein
LNVRTKAPGLTATSLAGGAAAAGLIHNRRIKAGLLG